MTDAILARWSGACDACGTGIARGDLIVRDRGRRWLHETCETEATDGPLADLACRAREVRALIEDCPTRHRPKTRDVFADFDAARREVRDLLGRRRDHEAEAIVTDWYSRAASRITTRLAHAPLGKAA